jgi:hypothetical protein
VKIAIEGTNTVTIRTDLLSIRYAESLRNAVREASSRSPNYRAALAHIATALEERPSDPEGLRLKVQYEAALKDSELKAAERTARDLVEAQNRLPAEQFASATRSYADVELFDTHRWEYRSDLDSVRAALFRAIRKTSIKWTRSDEARLDPRTMLFHFSPAGFLTLGRRSTVLLSEVRPGEVHVCAKFWDYVGVRDGAPLLAVILPDKTAAVHKKFFKPDQAGVIDARRRDVAENFRATLESELR